MHLSSELNIDRPAEDAEDAEDHKQSTGKLLIIRYGCTNAVRRQLCRVFERYAVSGRGELKANKRAYGRADFL